MVNSDIKLVVQSDDFGMCHSGNLGTVRAFTEGIVTQASVMVPCPWFREAARLANEHAIPVGVHLTLTAEWDYLRWGPLTGARSLVGEDGRFPRTIEAVRAKATVADMTDEFGAQTERFLAEGLTLEYFDCHMGVVDPEPYSEMCRRFGKPFDYAIGEVAVGFDSIHMMSRQPSDEKVAYLVDRISKLAPGTHLIVSHCAVDSDELRAMTGDWPDRTSWSNEYRPSDLVALTAPEVRVAVDRRGIELVSVGRL